MSNAIAERNLTVATVILNQLGHRRFIAMTGAKLFVSVENGISFKLPARTAKNGISYVKIVLNGNDLYDVIFAKIVKYEAKIIESHEGIYAEDLQRLFKQSTGLDAHL